MIGLDLILLINFFIWSVALFIAYLIEMRFDGKKSSESLKKCNLYFSDFFVYFWYNEIYVWDNNHVRQWSR